MKEIQNIKKPHVYFLGIGGKGLNGIAQICLQMGYKVSGTDVKKSFETQELEKMGVSVNYFHSEENIDSSVDMVIRSPIVDSRCPEISKALKLSIPVIKRSQFLNKITEGYKRFSVAGSHGKSTTTALLGLCLLKTGLDPTIFGGAYTKEIGSYNYFGKDKVCIIEACEYDRSFYDLVGNITVITSLEKSHMEYYRTEENMVEAFKDFVRLHAKDAIIFINGDNVQLRKITQYAPCRVVTFGSNEANDYVIKHPFYKTGSTQFNVYKDNRLIAGGLTTKLPGNYNLLNIMAVGAVLNELGLSLESVRSILENFTGVSRRFEIIRSGEGVTFVDDFAHHPTQVKNLIKSVRQHFPERKIYPVFQPRQYHLIKTFLKEYGESFYGTDKVFATDILPALGDTQEDIESLSSDDIVREIRNRSQTEVVFEPDFNQIVDFFSKKENEKMVVATIGAGDVYKVRDKYLDCYNKTL